MRAFMRRGVAAAFACAVAFALVAGVMPQVANAAEAAVFTATVTPSYANPVTGQIDDAGGSASQALGESMVASTTKGQALVEIDAAGEVFVTLRIGLIDQIDGVSVECSSDGGSSFAAVETTEMQRDESHGQASADNTADVRFKAPSYDSVMRLRLDVVPMGREVVYFAQLSDLVEGNAAGFVQTVVPGEGSSGEAVAVSDGSSSAAVLQEAGEAAGAGAGEAGSGVSEFDADGNDVTGSAQAQTLEGPQIAMVVGCAAAVVAVAGVVAYAAYVRPKRAREAAAAAAASPKAPDDRA